MVRHAMVNIMKTMRDSAKLFLLASCIASSHGFAANALRRRDVPVRFAKFLRSSVILREAHCEWVAVDDCVSKAAMKRYFGVDMKEEQSCELFLIEGVPAASMLYTLNNTHGAPLADSFHINHGLLELFDAADHMRLKLWSKYTNLSAKYAYNRMEFLI